MCHLVHFVEDEMRKHALNIVAMKQAKMQVDGGYGAMSAEGHGESSGSWAGSNK